MVWTVDGKIYKQDIVIVGDNGDQKADTINCCALDLKTGLALQYPRAIKRDGVWYQIFKYSNKQDVVFYRKRK